MGRPVDQYFQVKSTLSLAQIVELFGQGKYQVYPARIVCLRPGRLIMAKGHHLPGLAALGHRSHLRHLDRRRLSLRAIA